MKQFLISAIFLLLVSIAFSQKVQFGVGGGLNLNRMWIDHPEAKPLDYRLGFQLNGMAKYQFNEKFALRAEPGYTAKRSQSNGGDPKQKFRLSYLSLPVLLDYSPLEKLSVLVGPEVDLRLTAKMLQAGEKTDEREVFDRKYGMGIQGGLGYKVLPAVELTVRYYHGLVSLDKSILILNEDTETSEYPFAESDGILFNRGFLFSLGFWFN